jgi:hypothetical protein
MATTDPTDPAAPQAGGAPDGTTTLVNLASAIGSGLGILGFVTLCGGALTWLRFERAGLPAEDAVAVLPKENLVTYGASVLVPAALAALAFVAVLYFLDSLVGPFTEWRSKPDVTLTEAEENQASLLDKTAALDARAAKRTAEARDEKEERVEALREHDASAADIADAEAKLRTAEQEATAAATKAKTSSKEAKKARGTATNTKQEVEEQIKARRELARRGVTGLIFSLGGLVALEMAAVDVSPDRVGVLVVVVIAAGVFSYAVLQRTGSFAWLALSSFVAVGVFFGFLNYYKTTEKTKVEPAAALRKDRGPIHGIFVAQTSDRIYLGTERSNRTVLTPIPRDEVVELVVGERIELDTHRWVSSQLALDLCTQADAKAEVATTPEAKAKAKAKAKADAKAKAKAKKAEKPPKKACTPAQTKALEAETPPGKTATTTP